MNNYTVGQEVRIDAVFTAPNISSGGTYVLTDPIDQAFSIKDPLGITTTQVPQKVTTGKWYVVIILNSSGIWEYRWEVTNPFRTAKEDELFVEDSNF